MRRIAVVITVGVVCLGTTAVALAPAEGSDPTRHLVVHHDAAQDVVYYPFDGTGGHQMPSARDPDITRVGVRNGEHNVWVRLTLRHLRRAGGADPYSATRNWNARIVTPQRTYRLLGWVHPDDEGVPIVYMTRRDCPRLRVKFDYARNVVTTMVPHKCIGAPRWIRAGVVFQRQPSGALYDDAFSSAPASPRSWGTLSRRVYT
jgi:hypothetical protein